MGAGTAGAATDLVTIAIHDDSSGLVAGVSHGIMALMSAGNAPNDIAPKFGTPGCGANIEVACCGLGLAAAPNQGQSDGADAVAGLGIPKLAIQGIVENALRLVSGSIQNSGSNGER